MEAPFPKAFLEKLSLLYKPDGLPAVLTALSTESFLPTLRVNTLTISRENLLQKFEDEQINVEEVVWYKDAFIIKNKTTPEITTLALYKNGDVYLQGLSSMLPALILNPKDTDLVLDMAAAPGSKTTQLASLMNNKGKIFANDISRERLFKLKAILKQYHVTNTEVMSLPGEKIWQELPDYFDKVLLDAPCSMEGRFNSHDEKSYNHWSPKKVKELSHRQKYLLWSAISCTKIGGTIVYSTCTISPEENEEVIDWVLEKSEGKIVLDEINITNIPSLEGLTAWKKKQYSKEVSKTLRISPHSQYEGFFVAKLKRIK